MTRSPPASRSHHLPPTTNTRTRVPDIQRGHHRLVKQGAHSMVVNTHPDWTDGSTPSSSNPQTRSIRSRSSRSSASRTETSSRCGCRGNPHHVQAQRQGQGRPARGARSRRCHSRRLPGSRGSMHRCAQPHVRRPLTSSDETAETRSSSKAWWKTNSNTPIRAGDPPGQGQPISGH